ncbi:MAG: S8 family serine peptidase [Verrucomicrobia bacterium]|nr:S8 family serine peptidase [Verrucomicrobiota bacterium]
MLPTWLLASIVLLWDSGSVSAQEKSIRLRNETLLTPPPAAGRQLALQQAEDSVSGLYLIQFDGRLEPGWPPMLENLGARLLLYVPDDAFIARLDRAGLSRLRALPFVRWVGEYKVEYKAHAQVRSWWKQPASGDTRRLNLLLSPQATPVERAIVARLFQALDHQGSTRFAGWAQGMVHRRSLLALLRSPAVLWVELAPRPRLVDEVAAQIVAGAGTPNRLYTQDLGFDGAGVIVAVADSGLDTGNIAQMHPDIAGRVASLFFYGALTDASDGHSHGTHVTGIIAGNGATGEKDESGFLYGLGVAPGARVVAQRIFDPAGGYEAPPSYEKLTRDAVQAGADVGSNSWGDDTQGRYDISASQFDALVRDADASTPGDQAYILEFSAGNAGPGLQTIGSPAVGKNVIATGASENNRLDLFLYADGTNSMADFSSRGPCEDGRIKPDISAPGTWISSMKSRLASDENAWGSISENYIYQGGTSQAGPQVSGAAAVFVQYYKQSYGKKPSPALTKAALINSAIDMDDTGGTGPIPNGDEGWGRVSLPRLIGSTSRLYDFVDQTTPLSLSQVYERRVIVLDADEELKITMVYTDAPGFPGALPALVNDLDLEVVGPDGTLYRGNQFNLGESVANPVASDRVNNVEAVHLASPRAGEYVIRVRAVNVAQDSRRDTPALDQDFALVISGSIPAPGVAAVLLDRGSYTAPATIRVTVLDPSKAGQPSVNVTIQSGTETSGESLTLKPGGSSIVFTGTIATATGPAVADGKLQVAHGNAIEARYAPQGAALLRATAVADLVGPVITGVSTAENFGAVKARWITDEPSTSKVCYGLAAPNLTAFSDELDTVQEVDLTGLAAGKTYKFYVISTDEAGNSSTNDNGGAQYSFVAPQSKTVLLVDAYDPDDILDTAFIPLSSYTAALDGAKISYDVWPRSSRPQIKAANLKSYRAVIWRINDMDFAASIAPAEMSALTSFVASGGGFFMASMEALSRFSDPTFQSQLAHVAAVNEDTGAGIVAGAPGDPVANGMRIPLNYANYPDLSDFGFGGPDFSDQLTAGTNAAPIFYETVGNNAVGVRSPANLGKAGEGRTVFLGFPLDAVPMTGAGQNNRVALLRSVIAYLAPGADGIGTLALNGGRYTLPSRVQVEVGDSDLAGTRTLVVKAFSDSDATGISVTLTETSQPGVFRGAFTLIKSSDPAAPGRLRARDGDAIRVEYVDATTGNTVVRAAATIDTVTPAIATAPDVETDYEEATVSWDTSEPTDGLVEFGETIRLGRTAYASALDTSHSLTLQALAPDRLYYFRVVSRDQAGNAVKDDNQGRFYTFSTLKPLSIPWSDDMDSGATNWMVLNGDGSQETWTLGVPHNGQETEAHSPPNAWGSNRNGGNADQIENFLVSPSMNLAGGNKATLRFWHSYDFSFLTEADILNGGELLLITNTTTTPITLLSLTDEQSRWIEEEIDLTPYLGHVGYLAFHYVLFSFDNPPRPGWLIDDFSIEVENTPAGVLEVTNNIAQARFVISGPKTISGQGWDLLDANVPAGAYTITFGAVPYYETPPPQNLSIVAGQKATVAGLYSIVDANNNGIADSWEQQYFGGVAASHPGDLDSDNDGMTDLQEFLAGTNPTQAESKLRVLPPVVFPTGSVQVSWPSTFGRAYRLVGSDDLSNWSPVTDWVFSSGLATSVTLGPETLVQKLFLRLETRE